MYRVPFLLLVLLCGATPMRAQAADSLPSPKPDGRVLRPGIDSLAIYLVDGTDTTRTGLAVDKLEVYEEGGRTLLRRVYESSDRLLGTSRDTLVDVLATLEPVRHRSRTSRSLEFLEFTPGAVKGWLRLANGDSVAVDAPLPARVYNSSSFDLVIRASPLSETWEATIPALLAHTRSVVSLRARVTGSEVIDDDPTWKVEAEFTGLPVTFWISKATRVLRQQAMVIRPDMTILFAAPKAAGAPVKRST
jgi:hypothetical protein